MWDSPEILRSASNTLFALSVLLISYGAIHYIAHLPDLLPLQSLRLEEKPQRVDEAALLQAARAGMRGNLMTVDIDQVRQSMEKLPWVRRVSVRREFPDGLTVHLEEHQVLARWDNGLLVNQQGEVFAARTEEDLPDFSGPEGTSLEVTASYKQFAQQLALVGLQMGQINLSPRHAWQLRLTNGVVLELGREDVAQRMERFVAVYPYSLAAVQDKLKYVDLRYRNGFAVGGLAKQG